MKRRRKYLLTLALLALVAVGCGEGSWSSGDRVLVARFFYDSGLAKPRRFDVVVFRYPKTPMENGTPKNYIKRLLGLPGELLAILFGRLYRSSVPAQSPNPEMDREAQPNDLWQEQYLHSRLGSPATNPEDRAYWETHKFEIVRKPLDTLLAMRRLVYDNDFPAKDLQQAGFPARWAPAGEPSNWVPDEPHGFRNDGRGAKVDWLRYRHILRPRSWPRLGDPDEQGRPLDQAEVDRRMAKIRRRQLITDFLAYNNYQTEGHPPKAYEGHNWVGDLMLECKLKVEKAGGEFCMELSKGVDRFQALFDLQTGECTLVHLGEDGKRVVLATKPTRLKAPGEYDLRFANIDERLTVWVDRDLPFDDGVTYSEPTTRGPTGNDLEPASLGSKGAAVAVHKLKLWRDTYYTLETALPGRDAQQVVDWANPQDWQALRELRFRSMYVQPGHYLCLGDNSPQSSDSRDWGTVPERLMLGRALMVYFPFDRAGRIK
jgi:signal peptidase I